MNQKPTTTARATSLDILERTFHQYSALLILLLVAVTFGLTLGLERRVAYFGLAWVLLAVLVFQLRHKPWDPATWQTNRRMLTALLALITLTALILRLLPLAHTNLVIGYDYGFYKATMLTYEASATIPEGSQPHWMADQFPPGLFVLHKALYEVAGLDAHAHLRYLFPILGALMAPILYAATRNYFGTGAGLIASAFYSLSFTQYTVHEYLYEKNVLALILLLLTFFTLNRRAWVPAGVLLGAIGILHRPTFLLAALSVAVIGAYALARGHEKRGFLITGLVSLPLFLPLWLIRADTYFTFALRSVQTVGDNVGAAIPEGGGTFLTFLQYQNAAVTYLPLAFAGALLLLFRRQALLPVAALALSTLNVLGKFIFFNRFIIMLDLVSYPLVATAAMATTQKLRRGLRPAILAILLILTAIPTILEASKEPGPPYLWINDEQHTAITWISENTPNNATILASNLDSPYVIADSGRRTYGPGLFDDRHTGAQWRAFFATQDAGQIQEFLKNYPTPVYIYHAEGHGEGLGTAKFKTPLFTIVHTAPGATVWQYTP
jgi:hypothetical protein